MSVTATIDPYDQERQEELAAEAARDEALRAASRRQGRDRRLGEYGRIIGSKHQLPSDGIEFRAALRMRQSRALAGSALRLGYHFQPVAANAKELRLIRGRHSLVIRAGLRGTEIASTAGTVGVEELMREHGLRLATAYLSRRNMQVRISRLRNGEIELVGESKPGAGDSASSAAFVARVARSGKIEADIQRTQGPACEQMLLEFARAVGGSADMHKKNEYFLEPTIPSVRKVRLG